MNTSLFLKHGFFLFSFVLQPLCCLLTPSSLHYLVFGGCLVYFILFYFMYVKYNDILTYIYIYTYIYVHTYIYIYIYIKMTSNAFKKSKQYIFSLKMRREAIKEKTCSDIIATNLPARSHI